MNIIEIPEILDKISWYLDKDSDVLNLAQVFPHFTFHLNNDFHTFYMDFQQFDEL